MKVALENRSEMDHAALEAQELWLACSALQSAIEKDGGDGSEVGTCTRHISERSL